MKAFYLNISFIRIFYKKENILVLKVYLLY